ncbi:DUF6968 family protein [Streptomonospora nanhaiensis]|uniref:DUF6968 domain-containing protein n=1 Tax=Streptomonospora nanhaiensis TaxID=1323731 RepID=A0A853BI34_9ACTN|nr:hypothetical protein [Streptomonospora nanhaiensis]MBV2366418.1 DUF2610 domain-containing protein [Streptomonospora nanhaiensis]MBX9389961.1 DUF2610 domain-containing protein [Streptomonospora nanhaiensis]NYI94237.1 hypothetical protein [Streptomonospora nanhaiensis]
MAAPPTPPASAGIAADLGEVVAERVVEAVAPGGARTPVRLRIGRPRPDTHPEGTGTDWCCPWQVEGLGNTEVQRSYGVDSLQALLLAVYRLRLGLQERARSAGVRLEWLGMAGLGLAVEPDLSAVPPAEARGG